MLSLKVLRFISAICWVGVISSSAEGSSEGLPFTVKDDLGVEVEFTEYPQRIVSLAPSNTEILYALGLEDRVVGVTSFCDYPPAAKKKEKVGGYTNPSVERIVALKPDLVLAARGNPAIVLESIRRLGIVVFAMGPKSINGVMEAIEVVGRITGHVPSARSLISSLEERVKRVTELTDSIPPQERPRVFWGGWNPPIITAGPGNIIDDVIHVAGGVNIARDADRTWPEYNLEMIVLRDPQVIITGYMDMDGDPGEMLEKAKTDLKKREGWRDVSAVKDGRIYFIETDLIGRPGPRLVDGLEKMARCIHPELFIAFHR